MRRVLFTTAALILALFISSHSEASENTVSLIFNYSGTINQEPIVGQGNLVADPSTGRIDATASFSEFPSSFTPTLVSLSTFSISCINGGRSEGPPNIVTLSAGDYRSVRRVQVYDGGSELIGNIEINGHFRKVADKIFEAEVLISGFYNGPVDLVPSSGYTLPTNPQPDGTLRGSFTQDFQSAGGEMIRTQNEHVYSFDEGITQPLVPNVMVLTFEDGTKWYPSDKILRLFATSVIRHP